MNPASLAQTLTLPVSVLLIVVFVAAWNDWRERRIPNWLIASGIAAALQLAAFAQQGIGVPDALLGMVAGFAMFLPLYLLRGMAAGDVKLIAVVGAFTGPATVFDIALGSFVIGGVWGIGLLILDSSAVRAVTSMVQQQTGRTWQPTVAPTGQLQSQSGKYIPYGVVIALATVVALWLHPH